MSIISVPKPLRDKLGDEGSDALIDLINRASETQKEDTIEIVEERFERRLGEEIAKLSIQISEVRADLIKWMFIFWVGQMAGILGILFAFFR